MKASSLAKRLFFLLYHGWRRLLNTGFHGWVVYNMKAFPLAKRLFFLLSFHAKAQRKTSRKEEK